MGADSVKPIEEEGLGRLADANASSDVLALGPDSRLEAKPDEDDSDEDDSDSDDESEVEPESGPPIELEIASKPASSKDVPATQRVEALLSRADYQGLSDLLGPIARAERMPAMHRLIFVLAQKELATEDQGNALNRLAIKSVAELLDVASDSQAAVIIAKRVLRSQASWRERKAPPAPARIAIIVIGIAVGIIGGWLAGPGSVEIVEVIRAITK
jgi:hypothetical protein